MTDEVFGLNELENASKRKRKETFVKVFSRPKEELVNEAEKSLDKRLGTYAYIRKQDCYTNYVDGYIDSAEPREKRIAELEAQIEKMKCCGNCNNTWNGYHLDVCDDCKNHDKWEIKEK